MPYKEYLDQAEEELNASNLLYNKECFIVNQFLELIIQCFMPLKLYF
jgi:hypothetical protein